MYRLITAVLAALWMALPAVVQAQTTLVINAFLPPQHIFNVDVMKPWAADVERVTQGRVKVVFPPTSIGSPQQQWDVVRKRIVDGAYIFNGLIQNKARLVQLAHLPLGSSTAEGMSIALWRTYTKYFETADEYRDVHLLALVVFPAGELYGLHQPVTSLDSIHGVKFWALPGVASTLMDRGGAGVVATPAAKMSELVAGGTVDGFAGIPEMDAARFNVLRYARYETTVPGGVTAPSFSLFVNRQVWESIAPADRDAITALSGEAFARRMATLDTVNRQAREQAVAQGLKLVEPSPAFVDSLRTLAQPLDKQWLANAARLHVDGPAALAYYRSVAQQEAQP
ncbi:TRAP transporter substrate-binding protein DctP [Paraburkholderia antibiotica]|uniref:TRAP transporter substrate-binding protein DctP n=1 Tax=Paraburkholderia antibiotica TaxID=2728839 RepID=A0A7X9X5V5_9BURK|nr:TRAP transporter substrate-binding protein DctP [Paraburkholderia antibiotica]NML31923.1 TRAP transporter substrate-binding protein DctP [Paraburkholderia antibiotica]